MANSAPASFSTQANALFRKNLTFQVPLASPFYFPRLLHCMKSRSCLIFSYFKETERENQRSPHSVPGAAMLVAFPAPIPIRH